MSPACNSRRTGWVRTRCHISLHMNKCVPLAGMSFQWHGIALSTIWLFPSIVSVYRVNNGTPIPSDQSIGVFFKSGGELGVVFPSCPNGEKPPALVRCILKFPINPVSIFFVAIYYAD